MKSFTTYQVTTPSKLSWKSSKWTRWIGCFKRFTIATELDKKYEAKQNPCFGIDGGPDVTVIPSTTYQQLKMQPILNQLGVRQHQEYDIKLTPKVTPFAITVPRQVLIPLRKKTERELQRMKRNAVISREDLNGVHQLW